MPTLFTKQVIATGLCAAASYICSNGGEALENKQVAKAIACAVATACAAYVTVETAQVAKKSIEEALPVVGKGLKAIGHRLKK